MEEKRNNNHVMNMGQKTFPAHNYVPKAMAQPPGTLLGEVTFSRPKSTSYAESTSVACVRTAKLAANK